MMIDHIQSMNRQMIHSAGTDQAMAQTYNDLGSFDNNFPEYILEGLIEHPENFLNHISSSAAATEAIMRFSARQGRGRSDVSTNSPLVHCSDCSSNRNLIRNITSISCIENIGLVDGSTIVESGMSLGCQELSQWSGLEFSCCAILF